MQAKQIGRLRALFAHNSIRISMGMRRILNKVFASAIDNYYHQFALRDKASDFRLLTEKHDIAHIASSVF
ncbi:hypothetical protein [Yersinia frederiksenii]|uniref:hypothetical protein n=1 Tax=Yersinia frederiksenii TaxID=29484 RepID=UPI0016439377|nr:hypothetical protein [Yersinia frederiksenii]